MKVSKDLAMKPILIGFGLLVVGVVVGTLVVAPYRQKRKAKKLAAKAAEKPPVKKAA